MRQTREIPIDQTRPIPVSAQADFGRGESGGGRTGADGRGDSFGRRRTLLIASLIALLLIAGATAAAVLLDTGGATPAGGVSTATALSDARTFLNRYARPSGQVVRADQGGDTVSEGQAYGMLLAEATGRTRTFDRIWTWTQHHLQRPDGLLAFHASPSGQIESATPASDADVLAAWALARAQGPGAARLHAEARRMSAAVLARETTRVDGQLTLAAGPWATGTPASLDPSYWSPQAFAALAATTGDERWNALARSATALTQAVTAGGTRLPADWVKASAGSISAEPAPGGSEPQARYGLDAQRLVVWMAASCTAADRALAARWWTLLSARGRASAIALSPTGAVISSQSNALDPVAAAAAAGAAGDTAAERRLLGDARRAQTHYATYYGGAWLALGELLLGTDRLGGCATRGGNG